MITEKQINDLTKDYKLCYGCEAFDGQSEQGKLQNCSCAVDCLPEKCAIAEEIALVLLRNGTYVLKTGKR